MVFLTFEVSFKFRFANKPCWFCCCCFLVSLVLFVFVVAFPTVAALFTICYGWVILSNKVHICNWYLMAPWVWSILNVTWCTLSTELERRMINPSSVRQMAVITWRRSRHQPIYCKAQAVADEYIISGNATYLLIVDSADLRLRGFSFLEAPIAVKHS